MKLSTKGKYGLYAMYYLAQHAGDGCQPLKSVAEIGVSEDYLEQLLGGLRRAGLVSTVRGAQGGYSLAKAPEEITVGDIIDALAGQCRSHLVWEYLSRSINDVLQSITLRDMLEQESFGCQEKA